MMVYCFDIDGTLCTNTDGEYAKAEPLPEIMYTARGATTGLDWSELTAEQLRRWGVRYHALYLGKPTADVYIDDRAINLADWKRDGFHVTGRATHLERSRSPYGIR
jgi:hypothetical protein